MADLSALAEVEDRIAQRRKMIADLSDEVRALAIEGLRLAAARPRFTGHEARRWLLTHGITDDDATVIITVMMRDRIAERALTGASRG